MQLKVVQLEVAQLKVAQLEVDKQLLHHTMEVLTL